MASLDALDSHVRLAIAAPIHRRLDAQPDATRAEGLREGRALRRGDLIGYVGATGNAHADARICTSRSFASDPSGSGGRRGDQSVQRVALNDHLRQRRITQGSTMGILDILQQYTDPARAPTEHVNDHFDQVARESSPQDLGNGVAAAFRSDATPPLRQMIGDLFGCPIRSSARASSTRSSSRSVPAAFASMAGGVLAASSAAARRAGMRRRRSRPSRPSQISPADASAIAEHAEKKDPSIMDRAGEFYAQHPDLVKGLGAAALAIALGRMHSARR